MVDEAKTENPLSDEEVRRLAAPPTADAVKALAAQAKRTKKLDKARVKARRMVEKVAKDLAAVCAELLRSDLPDRFLRVGRLVRLANQLQLEMSDRTSDLRARGGVQPLGGGGGMQIVGAEYDPLGPDYGGGNGAGVVAYPQPVPDNVQLMRELIGQIGVSVATVRARMRRGESRDEALRPAFYGEVLTARDGFEGTRAAHARRLGISRQAIDHRIKSGWDPHDAISLPREG